MDASDADDEAAAARSGCVSATPRWLMPPRLFMVAVPALLRRCCGYRPKFLENQPVRAGFILTIKSWLMPGRYFCIS
ncbi:hypothetical protein KCP69_11795 [Salmonella enterica subsp. enterica]|nr:hypothetical protein KCP69_11795 [Salmonella enterica subsp. enterica]